ncbi:tripartite tricarboxylate transporter substrate binding protein [Roseomonas sp. E05]|uniref:Bug family tripartite tricarboxylate transporter substrate binding protein n=1 Tax=Roseomonas sp. E05 TaxID=3046310 RepID=UPI0024BAC5D7|nr:tripartite tricarboxylate transporter substrate binding protein [Roseomonas sp. E05]MDJ0390576.1 tripartite tricarboxylate transporter substrate binding protein [Roseomonas sp. E05]
MTLPSRRQILAASTLLLAAAPRPGRAEEYPSHALTIVVGYPPGGISDTATRLIARRMEQELGQPVVVENRAGAATALASTYVAQADPNGYTLLMGATTLAINPTLQPKLGPQDPQKALAPVGMGYQSAFVLHVHRDLPVRSVAELIAYAKERPGKLNFGSSGNGAVNHLALARFNNATGTELQHVPYRGGAPALIDLRTGRIQGMFSAVLEALPAVQEGATRALGVSSAERVALLPEVPAVAETVPGFEAVYWQALFAPAGTPGPILKRLEAALRVATDDPDLRARLAGQGVSLQSGDAEFLRGFLARETESWGRVIRSAGISME